MNQSTPRSSFRSFIGGWLFAALLSTGCGEPQSSSSTNWLHCENDADCASVVGGTCRSDAICVDATGHPVPAPTGSAGTAGSGNQGGAAEAGSGTTASGGALATGGTSAAGGGSESGAAAGAGGAGTAGSAGVDGCPAGPVAAKGPCSQEGLVCEYAGSSVGIIATCQGGVWTSMSGGSNPNYVCPSKQPTAGAACPKPPTPAYSPLVCIYDCAQDFCTGQTGTGCGAVQTNCTTDMQSGEWLWTSMIRASCTI